MARPNNNQQQQTKKKERTVDFAAPAGHKVKLKKSKKKNKYLDLARELKKLGKMNVTFIPPVIDALVTVIEGLVKGTWK